MWIILPSGLFPILPSIFILNVKSKTNGTSSHLEGARAGLAFTGMGVWKYGGMEVWEDLLLYSLTSIFFKINKINNL
jgi:hypothetical protein